MERSAQEKCIYSERSQSKAKPEEGAFNRKNTPHLHSHQHLIFGGAEVVTFGQKHLSESSLAQLSLQNNVPPFNMLHIWKRKP